MPVYEEENLPRLGKYIEYEVEGDCWIYKGSNQVRRNNRKMTAKRHIFEQEIGPVPKGYFVVSMCKNKECINPLHLDALKAEVKSRMFMRDSVGSMEGRNNIRAKLTEDDIKYIRSSYKTDAELSDELGVAPSTIFNARNKLTWRNVH